MIGNVKCQPNMCRPMQDVRFVAGIWFLGKVYVASGKHDLAFRELGKAVENSRGSAWTRCMLGHACGVFGEPAKAHATRHLGVISRGG
jgi:hypothetical protein